MENLAVILIVVGTGAGITTVLLVVGGSRAKATRAELGGKIEALTAVVNPMVIEVKETRAKIDTLTGDVKANQAMISALDKKIDQNHNVIRADIEGLRHRADIANLGHSLAAVIVGRPLTDPATQQYPARPWETRPTPEAQGTRGPQVRTGTPTERP